MVVGSFASYPMGFYELMPDFKCQHYENHKWTDWYECKNTEFCPSLKTADSPLRLHMKHVIDEDSKRTLSNWVQ